jgi:hypothetical protein
MPENYPGIIFDHEGVCNSCRYFEAKWGALVRSAEERARSEARLRQIFEAAKRKGRSFDAVLGISGGKDSSYCLYLCKEVYGLNVLTCTRDNGFMSDDGIKRVNQLVKVFDVPHLYYRDPLAPELAGVFMRKTGNFCAPCELWSFNIHAMLSQEYDIPLIIMGSSSRTDGAPPKHLNPWDPWYFRNVLKGEHYEERLRNSFFARNYVAREALARMMGRRRLITLPDYVDWDEKQIADLFSRRFDIHFGEEHSDCLVDELKDYLYSKRCGGSGPKVVKYSLLIRGGKLAREEALDKLKKMDGSAPPPALDRFLEIVGMTHQEFAAASEKTPQPYLTSLPKLFNFFRQRIRRQSA